VYLPLIIDCFDGRGVSWSIGTRPDAWLVNTMLDASVETVARNSKRPVVHSEALITAGPAGYRALLMRS
jgi:hypothetical protein